MLAREFLLEECYNVKILLDKTLRHDYGLDGSRHFFDECAARLNFLTDALKNTTDSNVKMLASIGGFLGDLAELICRIERSSLGEYSWPFVEELKKISSALCRESTLLDPDAPPKVYVFAEGGLASYAIFMEQNRPSASRTRLLTIVFPKALKNFVLLHTILGHELGHAVWRVSKHQRTLKKEVMLYLRCTNGALATPAATAAHLYSVDAPEKIKSYLASFRTVNQNNIFEIADWEAWNEEILCDLIGLVIFGPGFVAALCRLLTTVEPSGINLTPIHPLVAWRINLVLTGAKLLKYNEFADEAGPLSKSVDEFWNYMDLFKEKELWYDILPQHDLNLALSGIQKLLEKHSPSAYPVPTSKCISGLFNKLVTLVPPIGNSLSKEGLPQNTSVDFRHIIYAGWLAVRHESNIPFQQINQMCEHAIMQQHSIELIINSPSR